MGTRAKGASAAVVNIPTRYALIKRAEKMLAQIDQYFDEAADWGLSPQQSDPDGMLLRMRKEFVAMLVREGRVKPCPRSGERNGG